jgi:hypothetical protein
VQDAERRAVVHGGEHRDAPGVPPVGEARRTESLVDAVEVT